MSNLVQIQNNKVTTTSLLVAKEFKKEHKNVLRDINRLINEDDELRLNFEQSSYTAENNHVYPVYVMDKTGFTFLVTSFTGSKAYGFKKSYIKAFEEMEKQLNQPRRSLNTMELIQLNIQAIEQLTAKTKELEFKIEKDQPKVEFYEKVGNAEGRVEMSMASKTLGIGRNKLFNLLRDKGILRYNNEPYQEYIDRKWFEILIEEYKTASGETRIYNKTMVTPKGIQELFKMI